MKSFYPRYRVAALLLAFAVLIPSYLVFTREASAATFRNHVARVPSTPTSTQGVRIWMNSDTAFGETAGIEYKIGNNYVKVLGSFDTSFSGANWRADIPAQPNGTLVEYQLFTRNQSGQDYGFTGFNFSYTVEDGNIQFLGLKHNTFNDYYRNPFGAVPAGTNVTLRFRTDHMDVDGVSVRVYTYNPATDTTSGPVDYPMSFHQNLMENNTLYDFWTRTLTMPSGPAVIYYKFRITDRTDVAFYSDSYADDHDNLNQGGEGAASDSEPFPAFQITVYATNFQTPDWLQNANVYHVFPDRFRNGDRTNDYCVPGSTSGCPTFYGDQTPLPRTVWNEAIGDPRQPGPYQGQYGTQFFGGDLKGIEQKLDYIKSLGFDAIYMNPIFKGRSNHRYDTDNFLEVDPALGGEAALASLVAAANQRGIRLIFDGVFNHASSDSLYFDRYHRYASEGACEDLNSPFRSWFVFNNSNTPCSGSDYPSWFGFDSLPTFDENAPVRDFFYRNPTDNVTKHWYDRGASGWRFDVATDLSHNWWHEYRSYAKSYKPDGALIGENFPDASQYLAGDQLDSVMNYRFRKNVIGFARGIYDWGDNDNNGSNRILPLAPSQFDHALRSVREDYPPQATAAMLNLLDSHDTNRALYVLTFLGDNGLVEAKERLKLAALFQFTYPGAPMVYYGDEAALNSPALGNGPNGPEDDPYNRAPYPWADESGDTNVYGPADSSMISYYAALARLRKQHYALRTGEFKTLLTGDTTPSTSDNSTYSYIRIGGGEGHIPVQKVVVVLNNGTETNTASIPVSAYLPNGTTLYDAFNASATYTVNGGLINISLPARSGTVLLTAPAGDLTPPSIDCPANIAQSADASGCSGVVNFSVNATDNNSGVTVVSSPASGSAFPLGTTVVNVVATDAAGNSSTCSFSVTVNDQNAPALTAPQNVTVQTGANGNSCDAFVADETIGTATATDNCGGNVTLNRSGVPTGNLFPVGTTTITYTATDAGGLTSTATQTVTVIDNTPPTLNAPAPVTVYTGAGATSCGAIVGDQMLGAAIPTDNCSAVDMTRTGVPADNLFPVGTTTVTYTATDASGNTSSTTQTVTVIDNTAPAVVAPANATYQCASQVPAANASQATATDNCGTPSLTVNETTNSGAGSASSPLVITRAYTSTDAAGNTTTATQTITVADSVAPTISCPSNITAFLTPGSTATGVIVNFPLQAADDCGGPVTVSASIPSGAVFPVGTTPVTITATDAAGNTSNCVFNVTVLYAFNGFFSPVENLPTMNAVKAGQSVPVKFSLNGNKGLNILAAGFPVASPIACDFTGDANEVAPFTTSLSGLTYDPSTDQYVYVWKTEKAWANSCRQLILKLNDGSLHRANFQLK